MKRPSAYTRVPRHGPQVCQAFWALSRNAEWVMHPAQARRRQMNYNISFSRPYIPTDRAYWRSLIAFNSLLVHPCNSEPGPRERHILAVTIAGLFLFLSSIPRVTVLPSSRISSPFPTVDPQTSPRCQDYYYCSLFSFFFFFATTRSSDVNAATDRPRRPARNSG